jgi:5-formyltetrahydrofolate cyclo-ligase
MNSQKNKEQFRHQIIELLNTFSADKIEMESIAISKLIFSLPEYSSATNILVFSPIKNEFNTAHIVSDAQKKGKNLFYPWCLKESKQLRIYKINDSLTELEKGTFGILEPIKRAREMDVDSGILDLAIIPGLAYDNAGTRLGRGAGYYDRFLSPIKGKCTIVSPVLSVQLLNEELPYTMHDIKPDFLVTPERIIST